MAESGERFRFFPLIVLGVGAIAALIELIAVWTKMYSVKIRDWEGGDDSLSRGSWNLYTHGAHVSSSWPGTNDGASASKTIGVLVLFGVVIVIIGQAGIGYFLWLFAVSEYPWTKWKWYCLMFSAPGVILQTLLVIIYGISFGSVAGSVDIIGDPNLKGSVGGGWVAMFIAQLFLIAQAVLLLCFLKSKSEIVSIHSGDSQESDASLFEIRSDPQPPFCLPPIAPITRVMPQVSPMVQPVHIMPATAPIMPAAIIERHHIGGGIGLIPGLPASGVNHDMWAPQTGLPASGVNHDVWAPQTVAGPAQVEMSRFYETSPMQQQPRMGLPSSEPAW